MTINALFTSELQSVDATKTFSEVIDLSYGINEWSVSGWELRAGSSAALEHAASEALISMGYIWATPIHRSRPVSVPGAGVVIPKKQHDFPYIRIYPSYGFGQISDQVGEWLILNCLDDQRRPVGHTWGAIYNAIQAEDGFFTANPTYWVGPSATGTFNLALAGADRTALVNRVATYVHANLNSEKRYSLDPNDGDVNTTDEVCGFISEVAARVHELDGSTDAKFGLYAYAGHRTIPTTSHPHIYVQIALGFNDLGIGYPEMVRLWGEKVHEVALREYGEIPAQDEYLLNQTYSPFGPGRYDLFRSYGATGVNMESNYDFLHDAEALYYSVRYWKDHTADRAALREQLVGTFFNGDARVADYYKDWSENQNNNTAELLRVCGIIDQMQPANKEIFQRLYALDACLKISNDTRDGEGKAAKYYSQLETGLRFAHGLGAIGHVSEYGIERQLANSNVASRPDLSFSASPDWEVSPALPGETDYIAAKSYYAKSGSRPSFLSVNPLFDPANYTVVDVPLANESWLKLDGTGTYFEQQGLVQYFFLGPGTVTTTDEYDNLRSTAVYSSGLHWLQTTDERVRWSSGTMFQALYPGGRHEGSAGSSFVYFCNHLEGAYVIYAEGRFAAMQPDEITYCEYVASGNVRAAPAKGVARVLTSSYGTTRFQVMNPFLSSDPTKVLMPKSLAAVEFPSRVSVSVTG